MLELTWIQEAPPEKLCYSSIWVLDITEHRALHADNGLRFSYSACEPVAASAAASAACTFASQSNRGKLFLAEA